MKICRTCKEEKPVSEFCTNRKYRKTDGLNSECRSCDSARQKRSKDKHREKRRAEWHVWAEGKDEYLSEKARVWQRNNPEKKAAQDRRYREKHKDKVAIMRAEYARKNQGKIREYQREYQRQHREKLYAQSLDWRKRNPLKALAMAKRTREKNRDKCNERIRQWGLRHPEKKLFYTNSRRARKAKASGECTAEEFALLCARYDNRCLRCRRKGLKLTIDHIVPLSKTGTSNDISNVQPLCRKCNSAKGPKAIDYRPEFSSLLAEMWNGIYSVK